MEDKFRAGIMGALRCGTYKSTDDYAGGYLVPETMPMHYDLSLIHI